MEPPSRQSAAARLGVTIFGICRGIAIALLALAIYVALTNWDGDGSVWALRYFVLALVIFALGIGVQQLLNRRR
ncbi:MAG: hypothetical protein U5K33_10255 [Halofilum sp. (in: g-proteobacteria)]|nr:hypothetical protein [Halofilum sp. (in: g-proteobacteria)]